MNINDPLESYKKMMDTLTLTNSINELTRLNSAYSMYSEAEKTYNSMIHPSVSALEHAVASTQTLAAMQGSLASCIPSNISSSFGVMEKFEEIRGKAFSIANEFNSIKKVCEANIFSSEAVFYSSINDALGAHTPHMDILGIDNPSVAEYTNSYQDIYSKIGSVWDDIKSLKAQISVNPFNEILNDINIYNESIQNIYKNPLSTSERLKNAFEQAFAWKDSLYGNTEVSSLNNFVGFSNALESLKNSYSQFGYKDDLNDIFGDITSKIEESYQHTFSYTRRSRKSMRRKIPFPKYSVTDVNGVHDIIFENILSYTKNIDSTQLQNNSKNNIIIFFLIDILIRILSLYCEGTYNAFFEESYKQSATYIHDKVYPLFNTVNKEIKIYDNHKRTSKNRMVDMSTCPIFITNCATKRMKKVFWTDESYVVHTGWVHCKSIQK